MTLRLDLLIFSDWLCLKLVKTAAWFMVVSYTPQTESTDLMEYSMGRTFNYRL